MPIVLRIVRPSSPCAEAAEVCGQAAAVFWEPRRGVNGGSDPDGFAYRSPLDARSGEAGAPWLSGAIAAGSAD
jgi:hypothetical protein